MGETAACTTCIAGTLHLCPSPQSTLFRGCCPLVTEKAAIALMGFFCYSFKLSKNDGGVSRHSYRAHVLSVASISRSVL